MSGMLWCEINLEHDVVCVNVATEEHAFFTICAENSIIRLVRERRRRSWVCILRPIHAVSPSSIWKLPGDINFRLRMRETLPCTWSERKKGGVGCVFFDSSMHTPHTSSEDSSGTRVCNIDYLRGKNTCNAPRYKHMVVLACCSSLQAYNALPIYLDDSLTNPGYRCRQVAMVEAPKSVYGTQRNDRASIPAFSALLLTRILSKRFCFFDSLLFFSQVICWWK